MKYSDNFIINLSGYNIEGYVVLKIKDYGCGISKRDLLCIFDRGFIFIIDCNDIVFFGMGLYFV